MKAAAAFVTGLAVGGSTVAAVGAWLHSEHIQIMRTSHMSGIEAPVGGIIRHLRETADAGDCASVRAKLAALDAAWEAYRSGGPRPDGFQSRVYEAAAQH